MVSKMPSILGRPNIYTPRPEVLHLLRVHPASCLTQTQPPEHLLNQGVGEGFLLYYVEYQHTRGQQLEEERWHREYWWRCSAYIIEVLRLGLDKVPLTTVAF